MLYNGSDVIRDVEWVIFDEIHYINDIDVCYYLFLTFSKAEKNNFDVSFLFRGVSFGKRF